jgi:putative endonuclease
MYYVYLLLSQKDGRFYIGQTQDVQKRLQYHNSGRSKYTRNRGPWRLLAYKTFESRSDAMKEEYRLKRLKNKKRILNEFNL